MTPPQPPTSDELARFAAVLPLAAPLPEPQSSIELSRNSKGATWSIKVFHSDPDTALATACRLDDQLVQRFGHRPEAPDHAA
jgi:hypothetical protein